MFGYDYGKFRFAVEEWREGMHQELLQDISYVRARVEVMLEKILNSSSFIARTQYPGLEI